MQVPNKLPARYLALLVEQMERQGIDCSSELRSVGVSRGRLRHPQGLLDRDQLVDLSRRLIDLAGRRDSGLDVGAALGFDHPPELGQAMLHCATLREALQCRERHYVVLTQAIGFRVRCDRGRAELSWFPLQPVPYDILGWSFDLAMGSFHGVLVRLFGSALPDFDIYCSMPAPSHEDRYRCLAPARVHFGVGGMPLLRVEIADEVLDVAMPMADATLQAEAEQRLHALHPGQDGPKDRTAWVRLMLRNARGYQPTQAELAEALGLSVSTLARQLAAQGSSFRELAKQVRHEQAVAMLREGSMSVQDIAATLGYNDPANFVRAFRMLAGTSPGAFGRRLRSTQGMMQASGHA